MPSSKSKSKQNQESLTQGTDTDQTLIGSKGATALSVDAARGNVNVNLSERGLDADELIDLVESIGGGAADLIGQTAQAVQQANAATSDIARSATGSESEAGKLINKLAIPALLLAAVWFMFGRGRK